MFSELKLKVNCEISFGNANRTARLEITADLNFLSSLYEYSGAFPVECREVSITYAGQNFANRLVRDVL